MQTYFCANFEETSPLENWKFSIREAEFTGAELLVERYAFASRLRALDALQLAVALELRNQKQRIRNGTDRNSTGYLWCGRGRSARRDLRHSIPVGDDWQYPANHVLVDVSPERQSDLLGDSRASPTRIPSLHLHDRIHQFFGRALWTGTTTAFRGKQQAILSLCQHVVKMQERRWLEHEGRAEKTCPMDEQRTQTGDNPVCGA